MVDGENRLWLQEALIARGPRPRLFLPRQPRLRRRALAREKEARAKRLGVWASCVYRIEPALDVKRLGRLIHSYQLVEGTVVAVGEGGGRLYLNFTKDWRSDFTVSVDRKDASAFAAAGIDLKALIGRRLRARGFLAWRNGPMIEASHPEQIELLPEDPHEERTQSPPCGKQDRLSLYSRSGVIVALRMPQAGQPGSVQPAPWSRSRASFRSTGRRSSTSGGRRGPRCGPGLLAFLARRALRKDDEASRTTAEQIAVAMAGEMMARSQEERRPFLAQGKQQHRNP